jgi:hypothetical protein
VLAEVEDPVGDAEGGTEMKKSMNVFYHGVQSIDLILN